MSETPTPVFVDDSGRRRIVTRRIGRVVLAGFALYLGLVGLGFARDPRVGALRLPTFGLPSLALVNPPALPPSVGGDDVVDAIRRFDITQRGSELDADEASPVLQVAGDTTPAAGTIAGQPAKSTTTTTTTTLPAGNAAPSSRGSSTPPTGAPATSTTTGSSSTTSSTATSSSTSSTTTTSTKPGQGQGSGTETAKGPDGTGAPGQARKPTEPPGATR